MTKDELIAAVERAMDALQAALEGLDDAQLTTLPVVGEWTVKDVLAHLAVWESRLVTDLFRIERGVPPEVELSDAQVDQLNAQYYRDGKHRPPEHVLEDLHGVHLALLNRLEAMPEAALTDPARYGFMRGRPLSAWVAVDSLEHFEEHTAEILEWRRQRGM